MVPFRSTLIITASSGCPVSSSVTKPLRDCACAVIANKARIGSKSFLKCISIGVRWDESVKFQRIVGYILRLPGFIALVVAYGDTYVGRVAHNESYRVGIISFVDFVVRLAVYGFIIFSVEEDRSVGMALLHTGAGKEIMPPVVFCFQYQSGQSEQLPRPFAGGNLRTVPDNPSASLKHAFCFLAEIREDGCRVCLQRPLWTLFRFLAPESVRSACFF